jgi:nucleoside-diphosphate-sugar epimerase
MGKRDLIVVCGAGGFIGGHLIRNLLRSGHTRVRAIDIKPRKEWFQRFDGVEEIVADLNHPTACERAAKGAHTIYNLACDMGGMGFVEHNKAQCMVSVLTNTNLLNMARKHGVERYFFASSVVVYNTSDQTRPDRKPLTEPEAYPAMPDDGYGWEKLFGERMCRHFREDYGISTRVARFQPVYGPMGTWHGGRERVPQAICRKVAQAVVTGKHEVEVWGDGTQQRSFMYVDDCAKGMRMLVESDHADPINLGPSEIITINDLVDTVEAIAGVRLERKYKLDAPRGAAMRRISNALFKKTFGWEPSTPLREGLEKTYRWIYDEYVKVTGKGTKSRAASTPRKNARKKEVAAKSR